MSKTQYSFRRYEKKYLMTRTQYGAFLPRLKGWIAKDEYGDHTICNLYFDTDTYDLIRASIDKPPYKEKFRLRSYGVPHKQQPGFCRDQKEI